MRWLYNLPSSSKPGLLKTIKRMYGLSGEESVAEWIKAATGKIIGEPVVPPKSPFTLEELKKMDLIGVYEEE